MSSDAANYNRYCRLVKIAMKQYTPDNTLTLTQEEKIEAMIGSIIYGYNIPIRGTTEDECISDVCSRVRFLLFSRTADRVKAEEP